MITAVQRTYPLPEWCFYARFRSIAFSLAPARNCAFAYIVRSWIAPISYGSFRVSVCVVQDVAPPLRFEQRLGNACPDI